MDQFNTPMIGGDYELISTADLIQSYLDSWFPMDWSDIPEDFEF